MKRKHKEPVTVHVSPDTRKRLKQVQRMTGEPVSVIADAILREGLMTAPFETATAKAEVVQQRMLDRVNALERLLLTELLLMRESVGIFMRVYLNHTPAVPESERATASLSGQVRMAIAKQQIHRNVKMGVSILEQDEAVPRNEDVD